MLITHVRPEALCGKRVYDNEGRLVGKVIMIARRDGITQKVAVRKAARSESHHGTS